MSKDPVREVIHDVKSKCASLCSAADLLSKASPKKRQELLRLMEVQARSLLQVLTDEKRAPAPNRIMNQEESYS